MHRVLRVGLRSAQGSVTGNQERQFVCLPELTPEQKETQNQADVGTRTPLVGVTRVVGEASQARAGRQGAVGEGASVDGVESMEGSHLLGDNHSKVFKQ